MTYIKQHTNPLDNACLKGRGQVLAGFILNDKVDCIISFARIGHFIIKYL